MMMNLVWGVYNSWMFVLGFLTYNKYMTDAEDRFTTLTTPTLENAKKYSPYKEWFQTSYVMSGFYGTGWLLWVTNMIIV